MPKKKNGKRTDRPQMPHTPGVDQGPNVSPMYPKWIEHTWDFRWPRNYPPGTYPDWDARQGKARAIAALGSMGTTPRGVTRYPFPRPTRPATPPTEGFKKQFLGEDPTTTSLGRELIATHRRIMNGRNGGTNR